MAAYKGRAWPQPWGLRKILLRLSWEKDLGQIMMVMQVVLWVLIMWLLCVCGTSCCRMWMLKNWPACWKFLRIIPYVTIWLVNGVFPRMSWKMIRSFPTGWKAGRISCLERTLSLWKYPTPCLISWLRGIWWWRTLWSFHRSFIGSVVRMP